ncbi:unnamed protein product [Lupinus luteus]|uniref:Uncharacterized protein n=1 Tax=Lupinus luteus TaxID=3873 RepID=A0AAV1XDY8_LUPLU
MSRFIAKTLLLRETTAASRWLNSPCSTILASSHHHQSSQATKPKSQIPKIEREESDAGLKLLEDHIQRIIVKKKLPLIGFHFFLVLPFGSHQHLHLPPSFKISPPNTTTTTLYLFPFNSFLANGYKWQGIEAVAEATALAAATVPHRAGANVKTMVAVAAVLTGIVAPHFLLVYLFVIFRLMLDPKISGTHSSVLVLSKMFIFRKITGRVYHFPLFCYLLRTILLSIE